MDEGFMKTVPDREKAKSILKMVDTTLEMIDTIDSKKYPSNVLKEYYEVIRELITIVLLLDGYRTQGEGAHKKLIEYIDENYSEFTGYEIALMDELRLIRNRISYDGFFVTEEYPERKKKDIQAIIQKLKIIIHKKL